MTFPDLFKRLDSTSSINEKVHVLSVFFTTCPREDAILVLALFTGRRPKGIIKSSQLREWSAEFAQIPLWLLEECYYIVGDLAETTAKVLPHNTSKATYSLNELMNLLLSLRNQPDEFKKETIFSVWSELNQEERLVFNKLITGGFRSGISARLVAKGVAKAHNLEVNQVLYAISGEWNPISITMEELLKSNKESDLSKPYPFCLAYAPDDTELNAFNCNDFLFEWKYDGIRAQVIKRNHEVFIWSRGEELFTQKFPEIVETFQKLPNEGVWDGEILVWNFEKNQPQSFALLQKRIGTKKPTKKLQENAPCIFMAYDQLETENKDIRMLAFTERRKVLETNLPSTDRILISPSFEFANIDEANQVRESSKEKLAEGLMIKSKTASYESGRKKGIWWKWKTDPMSFDGVLIYAQRGHGRRANLYSDFTLAVKFEDTLVPVAKAYSGLTDEELKEINRFIKSNTLQSFGPVRSVKAALVFEIAFEGIQKSTRHKSGIAVRFPRIARWRKDKTVADIDTLENLEKMIELV